MKLFKKMRRVKSEELYVPQKELAISSPTGVTHPIHIVIDKENNCLEGVPPGWREQMDIVIGKRAVKDNREAARSMMFLQAKGNSEAPFSAVMFLKSSMLQPITDPTNKPSGPWDKQSTSNDTNNGETTGRTVTKGAPTKDVLIEEETVVHVMETRATPRPVLQQMEELNSRSPEVVDAAMTE
ncbi:uncharacterized protein LOC135110448 [Scylla paramamosain]|uniref:uncharacterized protein LOC135110448 n=1 Tax=Scylla paramamosain TaxID=85552 RepID=UPI003083C4D9